MHRYEHAGAVTTQISSLPFTDVDRAVAYSLEHDIPFLPELTALGDATLVYVRGPGKLSRLPAFKRHRFETVKVQCIGPAALRCGYDEDDATSRSITVDKGDEGWSGREGFVPAVLQEVAPSAKDAYVLVCGPPIMLKFTMPPLLELGFPPEWIITSLEGKITCGIGK